MKSFIMPLMGLTIASAILSMCAVVSMIIWKNYGFGVSHTTLSVCNSYLFIKYQASYSQGYGTRFITTILSCLCSILQTILLIRCFIKSRQTQNQSSEKLNWNQRQLNLHYLCLSCSIVLILPIAVFELSVIVEEGACWKTVYLNWIVILILSITSLITSAISWAIVFKYVFSQQNQSTEGKPNIHHNDLRQSENEGRNIFHMEGASQMYRTVKQSIKDNQQAIQPLLYQNSPIPLNPMGQYYKEINAKQPKTSDYPQQNTQQMRYHQSAYPGSNIKEYPIAIQQRKKVSSPDRDKLHSTKKSKKSEVIENKKKKFRQLNPFKRETIKIESIVDEETYDDLPEQHLRMNYHKSYTQLIKQNKRPKRNSSNLITILQSQRKQKIIDSMNEHLDEFLQSQNQKDRRREKNSQEGSIEFVEQTPELLQEKERKRQQILKRRQPELFYHKPRLQKSVVKRKKKQLFDNDIIEPNQFLMMQEQQRQKERQLIINKLKDPNSKIKQKAVAESTAQATKHSMKIKPKIKTKQDIMFEFLKSKYTEPIQEQPQLKQISVQQDIE